MKARTKNNRFRRLLIIVMVVLVIGGSYYLYGVYQIDKLSKMTFEQMLEYTTHNNDEAIITVGIIENNKKTFKVYGKNGQELPPTEHLYEIGSITKTFTTSLLSKAIADSKIQYEDTIDEYLNLSKDKTYPTVKSLVTHTSGYREFYFEMPMVANYLKGNNDFYGISKNMLVNRIQSTELDHKQHPFVYSNFGIATIGLVLEQVYNQDFNSLMNSFISEELGLHNTKIADGEGDLDGYWKWNAADVYLPAGALVSTITDMMDYVSYHLESKPTYLSLGHVPLANVSDNNISQKKMNIIIDEIASGWMIDNQHQFFWHNGATDNFNSYIGFDKKHEIGVVVLSNLPPKYRAPATLMGIELLLELQEGSR